MKHHPKDWPPAKIRAALVSAGVAQSKIATDLEVTPSMVNRVIDKASVSDRVRRAIARAIGVDITRIWPSTYLTGGPRRPGRPPPLPISPGR